MTRCVCLLRSVCAVLVATAAVFPIQALTFSTEGIHGAGFQNVVAIGPDGTKIGGVFRLANAHPATSQTISISVGVEATPHVYVSSYEGGAILVGH